MNVRPETIKLLEENKWVKLLDIGIGNDILNMTPKAPKQKWTNRVTSNCFCTARGEKKQQNEKAAYRMKENICKLHGWKSESESCSVMSDSL